MVALEDSFVWRVLLQGWLPGTSDNVHRDNIGHAEAPLKPALTSKGRESRYTRWRGKIQDHCQLRRTRKKRCGSVAFGMVTRKRLPMSNAGSLTGAQFGCEIEGDSSSRSSVLDAGHSITAAEF